jgi:hypothetical protein
MPSTTYEAPTPSQQEQDIYDILLGEIQDQQDWEDQSFLMDMEDRGKIWRWNEDIIDPETGEPSVEYTQDPEVLSEISDLQSELATIQEKIKVSPTTGQISFDEYNSLIARKKEILERIPYLQKKLETAEDSWKGPKTGDTDYGYWDDMTEEELQESMTEAEWEKYQLGREQVEHSRKALAGELPLSESLLDQKQEEFDQLKQVYGITGDNLETASGEDTVAIQNLNAFKKRWAQIEDAQRYGQSSSSMESAVLSKGLTSDLTSNTTGQFAGLGGGGNTINMLGSLLQPYQQYNMAGYQTQAANKASQSQQFGSFLSLMAMLGGAASSREFKTDIKKKSKKDEDKALQSLLDTPSYDYRYKKKMGLGDKRHTSSMTEESPKEIVTANGKAIDINDKLEFQSMAIKALAREVKRAKR